MKDLRITNQKNKCILKKAIEYVAGKILASHPEEEISENDVMSLIDGVDRKELCAYVLQSTPSVYQNEFITESNLFDELLHLVIQFTVEHKETTAMHIAYLLKRMCIEYHSKEVEEMLDREITRQQFVSDGNKPVSSEQHY